MFIPVRVLILALSACKALAAQQPNIVFILTDDQDAKLNSLDYMPHLQKHLVQEGLSYNHHYCTVSLCCPSRVSLLTGKAAHNTNVTDVTLPYGGYPKFITQGLNDDYLPVWLQEAGYSTYYVGKLMNGHTTTNYLSPYPKGWTSHDFLLDPFTYEYWTSVWQRDQDEPRAENGRYTTNLTEEKALGYIEAGFKSGSPFFLGVAPIAPHSEVDSGSRAWTPPVPAEAYKHLFNDTKIPRTPNFNAEEPPSSGWMSQLPHWNATTVAFYDEYHRNRLRALQSVDKMVDNIIQKLADLDILDNTYVIYSSDNGYHIGQHRLTPGKRCAIEEDINVPFIIRGPDVPKGKTVDLVSTHTDLAPTFLKMIGLDARPEFDGLAIPFTEADLRNTEEHRSEHVNVEMWGIGLDGESRWGPGYPSSSEAYNTYKTVRLISEEFSLFYTVYCDGAHALYDLNADPYQIHNLYQTTSNTTSQSVLKIDTAHTINGYTIDKITERVDALLMVLKTCKTTACTDPWRVIHPEGNVKTLKDALDPVFDKFYRENFEGNKVWFEWCEFGYVLDAEGSVKAPVWRNEEL